MKTHLASIRRFRLSGGRSPFLAAALLLSIASAAIAEPATSRPTTRPIRTEVAIEFKSQGDAQVKVVMHNVSDKVDPTFATKPKFAPFVLGLLGLDRNYFEPRDVSVVPMPEISGYRIEYKLAGLARSSAADGSWDALIPADMNDATAVPGPNGVVFTDAQEGSNIQSLSITLPNGKDINLSDDRRHLTFHMDPPQVEQQDGDVAKGEFHFDTRSRMMACLTKSYGYDRFPQLWVARASFTNTGNKSLAYSVRFRLVGYTTAGSWSPWCRTAAVLPGETIVDPYFPVLDVETMGRIEGTRPATVEFEYEYTAPDGKTTKQSESKEIQILGHNELVINDNCLDMALASFTTKDDPVVRKVAAMVCQQVAGGFSTDTFDGTYTFMEELYRFMLHNKVVYQSPPAEGIDEKRAQHVKYGREVITNRAGTCVDLAIFYASVCEAVGMHPVLFLPPGHCFPGVKIKIKDKQGNITTTYLAVETTCLRPNSKFEDALHLGKKELGALLDSSNPRAVDIDSMRLRGVDSMELPAVADNLLESIGIAPAPASRPVNPLAPKPPDAPSPNPQPSNPTDPQAPQPPQPVAPQPGPQPPIPQPMPNPNPIVMSARMRLSGRDARLMTGERGWNIRVDTIIDNARGVPCQVIVRYRNTLTNGSMAVTVNMIPTVDHAEVARDVFLPYRNITRALVVPVVYTVEIRRATDGALICPISPALTFTAFPVRR